MSPSIRALLSSGSVVVQPGQHADVSLTVQNLGETVDRYRIAVEGVPTGWCRLSREEVSVFPGEADLVLITLDVPPGAAAGRYPLRLLVVSLERPGEQVEETFLLEVAAAAQWYVALEPASCSSAGEANFRIRLGNKGNAPLTLVLEGKDDAGACFFLFVPNTLELPPGREATAGLTVRAIVPLRADGPRRHVFQVSARAVQFPQEVASAQGEWIERAWYRRRWPAVVGGGVLLLVLAGLLGWLSLRPSGGGLPQPTRTPLSRRTSTVLPSATPTDTPEPSLTPSPTPTPDLRSEIEAAIWQFTLVRAEAERTWNTALLETVCVDPYLSQKKARIEQNQKDGVHWETPAVEFIITSLQVLGPEEVIVEIRKTETKLFFPKGASVPDDEICSGRIYSWRNCTYGARYRMVHLEGTWFVAEVWDLGPDCVGTCQH